MTLPPNTGPTPDPSRPQPYPGSLDPNVDHSPPDTTSPGNVGEGRGRATNEGQIDPKGGTGPDTKPAKKVRKGPYKERRNKGKGPGS